MKAIIASTFNFLIIHPEKVVQHANSVYLTHHSWRVRSKVGMGVCNAPMNMLNNRTRINPCAYLKHRGIAGNALENQSHR